MRVEVDGAVRDEYGNVSLYWPRVNAARVRAIATMHSFVTRDGGERVRGETRTYGYEGWGSFRNFFIGYLGEEVVSVEMLVRGIKHTRELTTRAESGDVDIRTAHPALRVEVKCSRKPGQDELVIGVSRRMDFDVIVHVVNRGQLPEDGYYRCMAWTTPQWIRSAKVDHRRGWPCYVLPHLKMRVMGELWAKYQPGDAAQSHST